MRTWRTRRLGLDEADRLVAGQRSAPGHEGLAELLAAARAPASPRELAGERAAVAGFVAARQRAVPIHPPKGTRRVRVPVSVRAVAMKVAAGFAVLAATGTAAAAGAGTLPDGAQQRAHRFFSALGVPAPATPVPHPSRTGPGGGAPSPQGAASRTPGTTRNPTTPATSAAPGLSTPPTVSTPPENTTPPDVTALRLCAAWDAALRDPKAKAMSTQARAALAAAAGGEEAVTQFCATLRGPALPGHKKPKPTVVPRHPGDDQGDGNRHGNDKPRSSPRPDPGN
ncbi:hypothetical protein [Krasilnikovia sp. MM14-A1004]|uniref:hypothetical protein n=1 Tax=Krasilnikovia sp. MM14-A1004 TaxID=3373541 RepID=UPI00399D2F02